MCGIAGYVSRSGGRPIEASLDKISHRGPDARKTYRSQSFDREVCLGHVRLSILDLTSVADQPFTTLDGKHSIVFNGEIYNHVSLRTELQGLGWRFRTRSDTEVLLASLAVWGESALSRLDGMFAFAWWNADSQCILWARDRLGIKPLYYSINETSHEIAFASEIRGLAPLLEAKPTPDRLFFAEFLLNGFLYEPSSGVTGVQKLYPGTFMRMCIRTGQITKQKFWDESLAAVSADGASIGDLVRDSMSLQSVADVNVGISFSGGVDSAILASASSGNLQGLFVSFGSYKNHAGETDAEYVRQIAAILKLPLEIVDMKYQRTERSKFVEDAMNVARGTEEPISDYTYIASEVISRLARERGYKVLLSGMGGDELFAGYPRYMAANRHKAIFRCYRVLALLRHVLSYTGRLPLRWDRLMAFGQESDFGRAYSNLVGYFSPAEVSGLLGGRERLDNYFEKISALLQPMGNVGPLKMAMCLDRTGYLSHNLTVADKSSMAQSIELRVPILSNDLVSLSSSLNRSELVRGRQTKMPLKLELSRHLPDAFVYKRKVAFNPPLLDRVQSLGREMLLDSLTRGPIASVVDSELAKTYVNSHFDGVSDNTLKLWQLFYFSLWLQSFE